MEITPTTAVPTPPQGAVFVGAGTNQAGYTVSSAGDFNPAVSTTLGDFMIGSPFANAQAGQVNLFYGASTAMNSTGQFTTGLIANTTNPIALNNPTAPSLALTGVGGSAEASFVSAQCRQSSRVLSLLFLLFQFTPTPTQGGLLTGPYMAGYTVSSAGSFNPGVDSLGDFMIGSPGNGAGRVNLFYGVSTGTINSTGQYTAGLIANAGSPIFLITRPPRLPYGRRAD